LDNIDNDSDDKVVMMKTLVCW